MAGKPELSASTGVQNVVVYVSDGNFAQAYAVGQQHNVAPFNTQPSHNGPMAYTSVSHPKTFPGKPPDYNGGYFANAPAVLSHNGFPQPNIINPGYQNVLHNDALLNPGAFKNLVNYGGINTEVLSGQRQAGPGRPEIKLLRDDCDNREGYSSADSGYVSVVGGDGSSQSVRCDSVRSETAESSCSSLSSADEGLVLVQPQQGAEMVMYDGSVSVRPGGVVVTVGAPPDSPQPQALGMPPLVQGGGPQAPAVVVPFGWKRILNNGIIVYISPNNTALSTLDQVKEYLLTPGTCKCGLECPLKYDTAFNFDPKVIGKPWTFPPDTSTRDLTKLCNHKRKILEMATLGCKPPPDQMMNKDFNTKRKKRKSSSPYSGSSVSQILAQRERLSLTHPVLCKDGLPNQQYSNQVWPGALQHPINRCYTEAPPNPAASAPNNVQYFRYQNQDSSVNRVIMDQQPSSIDSPNISQTIPNYHHSLQGYGPPNLQQHIIGPNGQIIGVNPGVMPQQQKVFINSPPIESNAPGRPNVQMVPLVAGNHQKPPDRTFCNQPPPFQYHPQYDASRNRQFVPRDQQFSAIQDGSQVVPQRPNWQNRLHENQDERVPPLFQHTPPVANWPDDNARKKSNSKPGKTAKKRPYDNQLSMTSSPCPNIDVRQIPAMNQSPQITQGSASPSFMEDPSGYLAQQTALLNSTFSKQTGSYICNLTGGLESNEVPLPSNMPKQNFSRGGIKDNNIGLQYNQNSKGPADSTGISAEHVHCQGCIDNSVQYQFNSRPNSQPNSLEDPVTSSTYLEQQASPDSRPIQGGAISTSNGSPNPTPQPRQSEPQNYYSRPNSSMLGVVTTMASGRTVGSNTITSVLAGRANTSTVSVNMPVSVSAPTLPTQAITVNVSRSPLEMVQSVVSSIQVPQQQSSLQIIKHSPPGHILVSSGGQLIMPPPPPKLINQNTMPPISVSPMVTNVTAAQVIPAVAQQVLGQQAVLVNALPAPFVIQPGVAVTMDSLNQNIQIPQLVTGNVIQQVDPTRTAAMLSPDTKKKGKKRKMASQTIASMLQIAASQQNPGIVMSQPGFPQQVQMAHSPQGLAMQALTIVPGKPGAPPQLVMNSQNVGNAGINLLQPVNLINGPTGMVQNFPTIQQFIVPNLGSVVMNADGTATILQDTTNLGMQLQLQNVNGQNVLTPVQNSVFNGNQSILTAAPTGMVIRSPATSQGKIIQQQHSPGAQFLSPNTNHQFVVNGAQFSGQLSPLVANVSPTQMTFSAPQTLRPNTTQPTHQDFIQCGQMGQTLMVPAGNISVSSANQQNTTYVQQNTTIVQQQTTMVANNNTQNQNCVEQNFNRQQPLQAVLVQQTSPACRHSVSTQTAINQNTQAVTTNTFCQTSSAGSPPDTTTHSPLALEGADTTTHSGSTDEGLSPAPSNCSDIVSRQQSCSMAMVHCITSSEPDSADLNLQCSDSDWTTIHQTDIKKSIGYSTESTTVLPGIHFVTEQMKQEEAVVSSRNFDKMNRRKHGDTLVVMENRHLSLFEDSDENNSMQDPANSSSTFLRGDLVWGPRKGHRAWPGKLIQVDSNVALVKWFGGEKTPTKVDSGLLQTLTQGLEAHHRARKNCRKSRKLDNQLEKAIHEAMAELDKTPENKHSKGTDAKPHIAKKPEGRLLRSQK